MAFFLRGGVQRSGSVVDVTGVAVAEHVVASVVGVGVGARLDRAGVEWLWRRLREAFPDAWSCVLMPTHVHLLVASGLAARLGYVLRGYTRRYGTRLHVAPPQPTNTAAIAQRTLRYQWLNPVRARLVDDPWQWRWSTLRDVGGVAWPVWTPLSRVAALAQLAPERLLARCLPEVAALLEPSRAMVVSDEGLRGAVQSVLREVGGDACRSSVGRQLYVQASYRIGHPHPRRLADALGCGLRTIHRMRRPPHVALETVVRTLADPRTHGGPLGTLRPRALGCLGPAWR